MSAPDLSRRRLLVGMGVGLAATACGGGTSGGPPSAGGPTGRLITSWSNGYVVYRFASRTATQYALKTDDAGYGLSASSQGLIAVTWDFVSGPDPWRISLMSAADGSTAAGYQISRPFSQPISAAAISPGGQGLAIGLADPRTGGGYLDRVWLLDRSSSREWFVDPGEEAAWAGNDALIVRAGTRLRLVNAQAASLGNLPMTSQDRTGTFSASLDGRYVVFEDGLGDIRAYDRTSGQSWLAATTSATTLNSPVLSPDSRWLAVLRGGLGLPAVHVVAFAAGLTSTVTVDDHVETGAGSTIPGDQRLAWIPG